MPRWEADGKTRLELAALGLFLDVGYDRTTVAEIARSAGLTERSFYRYFTDKREALFGSAELLTTHLVTRVREAAADLTPYAVLIEAIGSAEQVFLEREHVRRRAEAIRRSPELAERELMKLAFLSDSLAAALVMRDTEPREARIAVDLAIPAFRIASEDWIATGLPFRGLLAAVIKSQRAAIEGSAAAESPAGSA